MYIFHIKQIENFRTFAFAESFFSPEQCDQIRSITSHRPLEPATLGGDGHYNPNIRVTDRLGISWSSEYEWLFERLYAGVDMCNRQFFNYDLTGFLEPLELFRYCVGAFFNWHMDFASKELSIRKLSLVLQLSESADYEGGDLELFDDEGGHIAPRGRGTLIVFPSFIMHRVTPITKGTRYSMVGFVSGPPYR